MSSNEQDHEKVDLTCDLLSEDLFNYFQSDLTNESEITTSCLLPVNHQNHEKSALEQDQYGSSTDTLNQEEASASNENSEMRNEDREKLEYYNRQRERVEEKVTSLFEKIICKNTTEENVANLDLYNNVNTIHYGNLKDSYDPSAGQTNVTKTALLLLGSGESIGQEEQTTLSEESLNLIKLIQSNTTNSTSLSTTTSYNLDSLNLIKKSSLTMLIERNRENKICCPFDELADFKLRKSEKSFSMASVEGVYYNKLASVDLAIFQNDQFMPNCVSSLLTSFFFDVFQPSELKQFPAKTIDILLKMKNAMKPQLRLNDTSTEDLFLSHLVENCLWNCFALFKFRFSSKYKLGFFNYLSSSVCYYVQMRRKASLSDKNTQVLKNFKRIMSYYVKALYLNGLVELQDLKSIVEMLKNTSFIVDYSYFHDFFDIIVAVIKDECPMRLNNSCRVLVKRCLNSYDRHTIRSLCLSDRDEQFLLFNSEFEQFHDEIRALLI